MKAKKGFGRWECLLIGTRCGIVEGDLRALIFLKYAIEKLKDTSELDADPRWKEIAIKVPEEYAKTDTH